MSGSLASGFMRSPGEVVRCLLTYTDWWQPSTSAILQVGAARRDGGLDDGFRPGLIETLEERTELGRRMARLSGRDRDLLFLWYVKQLAPEDIARALGISRRHCFRLRAEAIRKVVDLAEPDQAA